MGQYYAKETEHLQSQIRNKKSAHHFRQNGIEVKKEIIGSALNLKADKRHAQDPSNIVNSLTSHFHDYCFFSCQNPKKYQK